MSTHTLNKYGGSAGKSLLSLHQQDLDLQIRDFFSSVAASFSSQADKSPGVCVCVCVSVFDGNNLDRWLEPSANQRVCGSIPGFQSILGQNTEA